MIRRPPRSTQSRSSAASDVYKRQAPQRLPNQNISEETKEKIHEDKHYTEEKQKVVPDHGSTTFDHPIVVECPKCKSMVKVYASGKFKCPECNLHFTVDDDRTIYFDV